MVLSSILNLCLLCTWNIVFSRSGTCWILRIEFVLIRLTACALSGVKKTSLLNGWCNFIQLGYKYQIKLYSVSQSNSVCKRGACSRNTFCATSLWRSQRVAEMCFSINIMFTWLCYTKFCIIRTLNLITNVKYVCLISAYRRVIRSYNTLRQQASGHIGTTTL